jgi:MoaA/NifB/PqqE/SkfB family radical SAM enzyme
MINLVKGAVKAGLRQPYLEISRRKHKVVRPLFLDYAVTWRCNARCIMCDTWQACKDLDTPMQGEMSLEDWQTIFERDADFLRDIKKIGLTGGEPFLRKDITELVKLFHQTLPQARISVVSNGLMTKRTLRALERIKRFMPELIFSVSLDGIGEIHDKVRGIPGAFNKAMATMRGAKELGFTVTSGMVISSLNYNQIDDTARMLAGMGVDFSCNLQESGANFHTEDQLDEMTPEMLKLVEKSLENYSHHYYMDNVRRQLKGEKRTLPCYSGMTSYFLKPEGDLCVCNLLGDSLGNLKEQSFLEIADATSTWKRRDELKDCKCWSQCEVKNSAAVAPFHVVKWLAKSPCKSRFIRHYAGKTDLLPR